MQRYKKLLKCFQTSAEQFEEDDSLPGRFVSPFHKAGDDWSQGFFVHFEDERFKAFYSEFCCVGLLNCKHYNLLEQHRKLLCVFCDEALRKSANDW